MRRHVFVSSKRHTVLQFYVNISSGIVFCAYGQSWREQRRFTLQALRDFGVGKKSIEENIATEVDALSTCLRETSGKPVAFIRPVQKLVANVIFGIVFGKRYFRSNRY